MIRRILAALLGSLKVRIELAGLELQDEIDHVVRSIAMAIGGALLVCIGLALVAATVIVALWDSHRVLALAVFAVLFCVGGGLTLWRLARSAQARPPMFAETAAQFELDLRRLAATQRPTRGPAPSGPRADRSGS